MKSIHLTLAVLVLVVASGAVMAGDDKYQWSYDYDDVNKGGGQDWFPGSYQGQQGYDYDKGGYDYDKGGYDQVQGDVWYDQDDWKYNGYDLDQSWAQNQGWQDQGWQDQGWHDGWSWQRPEWRRFKALDEAYHDWRDRMKRLRNSRRYKEIYREGERRHEIFHLYEDRDSRYYLKSAVLDQLENFLRSYGNGTPGSYDLDDCWRGDRHDDRRCDWPPIPGWSTGGCWDTGVRYSGPRVAHTGYQYTGHMTYGKNDRVQVNVRYGRDDRRRDDRRWNDRRWNDRRDPRVYRHGGTRYDPNVNGVGDGIYHIVRGAHRDNDGEVMGGVFETFGNILILGNR